jgi:hypothetical protein
LVLHCIYCASGRGFILNFFFFFFALISLHLIF